MSVRIIRANSDQDFGVKAALALADARKDIHDEPYIILPTGNTPKPLYDVLRENAADVKPFHYVQLDEYVGLQADDHILFSNWLDRDVLRPLSIKNRMIFNSAADPATEIERIKSWHRQNGRIDVAVLGIGEDGHVGFNLSGCDLNGFTHMEHLTQQAWESNNQYWGREVPRDVITLGISELKIAKHTLLLARGEAKAEILCKAFFEEVTRNVPASYLQKQRNVTVIADEAALSLFPR